MRKASLPFLIAALCLVWSLEAQTSKTSVPAKSAVILEVWGPENATGTAEKNNPYSKYLEEKIGVGFYKPKVPWEGGTAYLQQLNIRMASRNLPDVFALSGGIETDLMSNGAIADLTDLLPIYAPNIYRTITKETWDIVKSASPTGDKIFFIPMIGDFPKNASYIRKDWLDRVGLPVPATLDEYVAALRAFKEKDANGNGDPNDEIPVSGRELGRWMDHLFLAFGVTMDEGVPDWDLYDGKLTYSAVTPNMKEAIKFVRMLYKEKLLDPETFLNKREVWMGKIYSDRVGSYWWDMSTPRLVYNETKKAKAKNPSVVILPPLKNPGYTPSFPLKLYRNPKFAVANKGETTVVAALKYLEWMESNDTLDLRAWGLEGLDYKVENGARVALPPRTGSLGFLENTVLRTMNLFGVDVLRGITNAERPGAEMTMNGIAQAIPYGRYVASTGMPAKIYGDFADIKKHTLYAEYLANIVIGNWDISKWDEFVAKWYATGGKEVTENARQWYAKLPK